MPALPLLTRKAGILHIQSQYRLAHTTTIRSTYAWPFYVLPLTFVSSRAARYTSHALKYASRVPGYTSRQPRRKPNAGNIPSRVLQETKEIAQFHLLCAFSAPISCQTRHFQ